MAIDATAENIFENHPDLVRDHGIDMDFPSQLLTRIPDEVWRIVRDKPPKETLQEIMDKGPNPVDLHPTELA